MSKSRLLMLLAFSVLSVTGCALQTSPEVIASTPDVAIDSTPDEVIGGQYRLHAKQFQSTNISENPVLVVVLHGDAPRNKPDYHYSFAEQVASANDNVVAIALLRPGYTDPEGNRSEGNRGQSTGDNWNVTNTDAIASAITTLKQQVNPQRIVLAGHSGGATIAANILWRHPLLIDAAVLVSCACNVNKWRQHMFELTDYSGFQGNIDVISPTDHIEQLPDNITVTVIVGRNDETAPPELSQEYATLAAQADKKVTLVEIPNKGHEIFLDSEVMTVMAELVKSPHPAAD